MALRDTPGVYSAPISPGMAGGQNGNTPPWRIVDPGPLTPYGAFHPVHIPVTVGMTPVRRFAPQPGAQSEAVHNFQSCAPQHVARTPAHDQLQTILLLGLLPLQGAQGKRVSSSLQYPSPTGVPHLLLGENDDVLGQRTRTVKKKTKKRQSASHTAPVLRTAARAGGSEIVKELQARFNVTSNR